MGNSGYEMLVLSLLEKPDLVSSMNISSEASYHVLWVPSRLFWPWLREGLGTESSFITSIRGWDQCPEWPCPAKSIPSWAAARSRAVRGIWTQVKWESECVCTGMLLEKIHKCLFLYMCIYIIMQHPLLSFPLESLATITTIMEALLFAPVLVFLKIGPERERRRGAETRLVVHLGVFDAPLFRWPPSLLRAALRFSFGSTTLFTVFPSNSATAGELL